MGWKQTLDALVCPACKHSLEAREQNGAEWIGCAGCGLEFPVRDGIPVLLVTQARGRKV